MLFINIPILNTLPKYFLHLGHLHSTITLFTSVLGLSGHGQIIDSNFIMISPLFKLHYEPSIGLYLIATRLLVSTVCFNSFSRFCLYWSTFLHPTSLSPSYIFRFSSLHMLFVFIFTAKNIFIKCNLKSDSHLPTSWILSFNLSLVIIIIQNAMDRFCHAEKIFKTNKNRHKKSGVYHIDILLIPD